MYSRKGGTITSPSPVCVMFFFPFPFALDQIQLGEVPEVEASASVTDEQLDQMTIKCAASFDGSWKSRGFHSRHGFVSAISADTGEVLDCVYLTRQCRDCAKWSGKKDSLEYLNFIAEHSPR